MQAELSDSTFGMSEICEKSGAKIRLFLPEMREKLGGEMILLSFIRLIQGRKNKKTTPKMTEILNCGKEMID